MADILAFREVVNYLKEKEIVYTISKGKITYYYLQDEVVNVKGVDCHYKIKLDDFINLFSKENFYLYTPKDEKINDEKDEQYYSWKNKGIN